MKHSLRVKLLRILLSLTLLTVLIVGVSGFLNLRITAMELTDEILKQTAARVDQQVEEIVKTAHRQTSIMHHLFRAGEFDPDDFESLANYWHEVVDSVNMVSSFYIIREDGAALFVVRSPIYDRVTVREVRAGRDGPERQLYTYSIRDHRMRGYHEAGSPAIPGRLLGLLASGGPGPLLAGASLFPWENEPPTRVFPIAFDVHQLPGYAAVRRQGKASWTDTYQFFGEEGQSSYPGVSYATPVLKKDGTFHGVLGIGFNVFTLCDFLDELDDTTLGDPFVVEQCCDGQRRLIAHSDRTALFDKRPEPGRGTHTELMDLAKVRDARIPAFVQHVPAGDDAFRMEKVSPIRFTHDGITYLGGYRGLDARQESPRWIIGVVLPESEVMDEAYRHMHWTALVAVLVLLAASGLSVWTAGQVARPLEELVVEVEKVGRLDLEPHPGVHSVIYEVDRLAVATEGMKTSLRSFRKYVPADLVALLFASGQEAALGGEHRRLTISFSDIANFTTISEAMTPDRLVEHLGEYLQALSEHVLVSGGTVDKYIGDAIMAFWGAPVPLPAHALAACTAAIRNQQVLVGLRERWQQEGKPPFEARIGINTGEVVVGNIGSARRMNYTVIGDAVNLASRLEGLNKYYGTSILIAEATYEEAKDGIVARPLDWVGVKGKATGVLVYELLGLAGETPTERAELADLFRLALTAYRRQEWDEAIQLFDRVLKRWPDDAPAREMRRRCEEYRQQPPGPGWDGVHRMDAK